MVSEIGLVDVNVFVKGKAQLIKMEKGVAFENNGGKYLLNEKGQLTVFDKKNNKWKNADAIKMNEYQYKAFLNVANNDKDAKTYTKADVKKSIELFKAGKFTEDMSKGLPNGYKIEKGSQHRTQSSVEAKVTNNKGSEAILKFSIDKNTTKPATINTTHANADENTVVRTEKTYDGWTEGYNKYGQRISSKGTISTYKYEYRNKTDKKPSQDCGEGRWAHQEVRNIQRDKDGYVVSCDMITNRDEAHESLSNFETYDNYTAVRIKNDKVYSIVTDIKDRKNWQQMLNKSNVPIFDSETVAYYMLRHLGVYVTDDGTGYRFDPFLY